MKIELVKGEEGLDVELKNGCSKRNEKYLQVARTLGEIWIGGPAKILGMKDVAMIGQFLGKMMKVSVFFNICLDLKTLDYKGEESGDDDEELLGRLYKAWKEFVIENFGWFTI